MRSFIVEFDELDILKSQPQEDLYASLVIEKEAAHINLIIQNDKTCIKRRFTDRLQTIFVASNTYNWEILDGSKENQQLKSGHIKINAGQRIVFTPEGPISQSPMTDPSDKKKPPVVGAVQWSKSEGGNGHWYLPVVNPRNITWDEAEQEAENKGGHLVTFTSPAEEDFVIRLINNEDYWSISSDAFKSGPWIGAFQLDGAREPDSGWRWMTGEPFLYSNWGPEQPNDTPSSFTNQKNVRFYARGPDWLSARWGDASLPTRSYVVEFDQITIPPKEKLSKNDPYGIMYVHPSHTDSKTMDVILHQDDGFHFRDSFKTSHTVFVPPGKYQWAVLDLTQDRESQQILDGDIEVKAGERVIFTTEGPSPQE